MNKDEILSKHKNENRFGDEREKNIRIRRGCFLSRRGGGAGLFLHDAENLERSVPGRHLRPFCLPKRAELSL